MSDQSSIADTIMQLTQFQLLVLMFLEEKNLVLEYQEFQSNKLSFQKHFNQEDKPGFMQ